MPCARTPCLRPSNNKFKMIQEMLGWSRYQLCGLSFCSFSEGRSSYTYVPLEVAQLVLLARCIPHLLAAHSFGGALVGVVESVGPER